jgi:uncharacterized membrane protein
MVAYILVENADIGCKKALKLSKQMTKGSKLRMFLLDLTFIAKSISSLFIWDKDLFSIRVHKQMIDTLYIYGAKKSSTKRFCQ